jgi:hypothetical protein
VDAAVIGFGTPQASPIGRTTVGELRRLAGEGHFASGSMGPKVEAALRFVESGGQASMITSLDRIADALRGTAGTRVEPGGPATPDVAAAPIGVAAPAPAVAGDATGPRMTSATAATVNE